MSSLSVPFLQEAIGVFDNTFSISFVLLSFVLSPTVLSITGEGSVHLKLLTTLYSGGGCGDEPPFRVASKFCGPTLVRFFLHNILDSLRFLLNHSPTFSLHSTSLSAFILASSSSAAFFARLSFRSTFLCFRATITFL